MQATNSSMSSICISYINEKIQHLKSLIKVFEDKDIYDTGSMELYSSCIFDLCKEIMTLQYIKSKLNSD